MYDLEKMVARLRTKRRCGRCGGTGVWAGEHGGTGRCWDCGGPTAYTMSLTGTVGAWAASWVAARGLDRLAVAEEALSFPRGMPAAEVAAQLEARHPLAED